MKKVLLILFSFSFLGRGFSQITKGNWLIGGDGRFAWQTLHNNSETSTGFQTDLSPNIGYFVFNKFAAGAKIFYEYFELTDSRGSKLISKIYSIGPFLRYYLLNDTKQINFLTEGSYKYSLHTTENHIDKQYYLTFSAGPAIFLNSCVAIEILGNYELYRTFSPVSANTFFISLGIQFHLEKADR